MFREDAAAGGAQCADIAEVGRLEAALAAVLVEPTRLTVPLRYSRCALRKLAQLSPPPTTALQLSKPAIARYHS